MDKNGDIREELLESLKTINPSDWNTKLKNGYTIRDTICQFVSWEEEYSGVLIDSFKNGQKPWFLLTADYSEFEKSSFERYKKYSFLELIERWRYLIKILRSEIEDIGEENLRKNPDFKWLFDKTKYQNLLNEIEKTIKK